ncbi:cytochrome b/b6 domain-containing protein [Candidatus Thiothrix sp. Deng01]|uniref:Cytochrome b/b6 domain-containing protein n=1 Tax=Candidatus Thiothrix phosphatis TaxID=3112415 RepID=A0ABU6CVA0_9GAMM|nr:cytochrome b/b6 domain-containing protein [Candidatus Thiothrix sp. Deng01]MEB4590318.1 cytochrome b/b6 domain-containing protein [Candidatus Thiothrix sp. Deng01]
MMQTTPVRIWDLPTRLFHWLLVLGIGVAWLSAELGGNWIEWHERIGVFLLALMLFRFVWGFMGSDTSRFSQFVASPGKVLQHWREMKVQQGAAFHAGHNPLGGWMVLALLAVVLLQATSGLFATDDIATDGPLRGLVSGKLADILNNLHHLVFNVILLLAAVHILAVVFYRLFKQTNLIKAMVVGRADWPVGRPQPVGLAFSPAWRGLALFGLIYACVYFGIRWLAG